MDERENPYAAPSAELEEPKPKADEREGMHPLQIAFVFVLPFLAMVVLLATLLGASLLWEYVF